MSRTLKEEAVGEEEEQVENHYDEVEKLQVRGSCGSSSGMAAAAAAAGRSAAVGSPTPLIACPSFCLPPPQEVGINATDIKKLKEHGQRQQRAAIL